MENATEALQMAFGVLVFVIALSISINAFGEARRTSQVLLDYTDREYDYTYVKDNQTTKRIVRAETIIPSIYKAYKENYKIVFKNIGDNGLYKKVINGVSKDIFFIDLEKEVLGSDAQKEQFIEFLLYGYSDVTDPKLKIFNDAGIEFNHQEGIYQSLLINNNFEESLGVYYQEEIQSAETDNKPNANKNKKRVITYTKQQ